MGAGHVDRKVRKQLYGHRVKVDKELLWKALEERKRKKKRRLFFLWLTGVGILVLTLVLGQAKINSGLPSFQKEAKSVQRANKPVQERFGEKNQKTPLSTPEESHTATISAAPGFKPYASDLNDVSETVLSEGIDEERRTWTKEENERTHLTIRDSSVSRIVSTILRHKHMDRLPILLCEPWRTKDTLAFSKPIDLVPVNKAVLGRDSGSWLVQLSVGTLFSTRSLIAHQPELRSYLDRRAQAEHMLPGFNFGAVVQYHRPSGWYMGAGVTYRRMNERFTWKAERTTDEVTLPDQIVRFILDQQGDTTFLRGDFQTQGSFTRTWNYYNKIDLIRLPISVGYRWNPGRWSVATELGLAIPLVARFNGTIIDDSFSFKGIAEGVIDLSGAEVHIGLGLGYRLSERFHVRLPIQFENLSLKLQDTPGVRQQYRLYQVALQLEYSIY